MIDTRPLVTTWSARKAHIDSGVTGKFGALVTRCSQYGVPAGERTVRGTIEQGAIDSLPVCGLCTRGHGKGA